MFQGSMPQLMAAYNQWQNQQVYAAAAQLSAEQLQAERGAFFGSIQRTLDHILWGDLIWLSRFTGEKLVSSPASEPLFTDFAQLHEARIAMDQRILHWADGLTFEWLQEPITWTSQMYGFTQTIPRWVQVQHLFNHQTHHRGQVGTLLKQLGVDVGITDIPMLPMLNEV
ncbi:damage-inducible protein DinB [Chitinibacter fontanus]|uniref:Damage-inducible protein DinB n=1 Tax=Chitinibacter fontanus TaxID=1737446 RepID=A0A7D5VB37_9NEIS|nr:DinB family protein [Chitinibacter fontanus]QLI82434.1 damage-inducible protein DinB [Chitinibacter fontanus]